MSPQVRAMWFYFQTKSVLLIHIFIAHIHKDMRYVCPSHVFSTQTPHCTQVVCPGFLDVAWRIRGGSHWIFLPSPCCFLAWKPSALRVHCFLYDYMGLLWLPLCHCLLTTISKCTESLFHTVVGCLCFSTSLLSVCPLFPWCWVPLEEEHKLLGILVTATPLLEVIHSSTSKPRNSKSFPIQVTLTFLWQIILQSILKGSQAALLCSGEQWAVGRSLALELKLNVATTFKFTRTIMIQI